MQKKQKKFVFDEKAWWPSWSGTCLIDGKWLMEEVRSELSFYAHNCVFKKSFHVSPLHASPLSEMSRDWHLSSNEWWYNSQRYEEVKEAIALFVKRSNNSCCAFCWTRFRKHENGRRFPIPHLSPRMPMCKGFAGCGTFFEVPPRFPIDSPWTYER